MISIFIFVYCCCFEKTRALKDTRSNPIQSNLFLSDDKGRKKDATRIRCSSLSVCVCVPLIYLPSFRGMRNLLPGIDHVVLKSFRCVF